MPILWIESSKIAYQWEYVSPDVLEDIVAFAKEKAGPPTNTLDDSVIPAE